MIKLLSVISLLQVTQNFIFNPTNISDQFKKNDEIQVDFNHVKFKITKNILIFCEAISNK